MVTFLLAVVQTDLVITPFWAEPLMTQCVPCDTVKLNSNTDRAVNMKCSIAIGATLSF